MKIICAASLLLLQTGAWVCKTHVISTRINDSRYFPSNDDTILINDADTVKGASLVFTFVRNRSMMMLLFNCSMNSFSRLLFHTHDKTANCSLLKRIACILISAGWYAIITRTANFIVFFLFSFLKVWFQNARAKWRRNMLRTESSKLDSITFIMRTIMLKSISSLLYTTVYHTIVYFISKIYFILFYLFSKVELPQLEMMTCKWMPVPLRQERWIYCPGERDPTTADSLLMSIKPIRHL